MRITVIGGSGTTGSAAVAEAARRGHTVTSVTRSGRHVEGAAADVIAISPDRTGGSTQPVIDAFKALIAARPAGRVIVVGGAGSLLDADGRRLVDSPDFPEDYRGEALAFADVLELFRAAGDAVAWTLVSPAPGYPVPESSGAYVSGSDSPVGDTLSAADMALALIDEAEKDAHRGVRFTVASA